MAEKLDVKFAKREGKAMNLINEIGSLTQIKSASLLKDNFPNIDISSFNSYCLLNYRNPER